MKPKFLRILLFACLWLERVCANPDAKRLYDDVLVKRDYNGLIRPVSNHTNTLTVYLGLKLAQLIDIDEKNQIMTTNVWVQKIWNEPRLRWNPKDYGQITRFRVPSSDIWQPDVVLFNNADGNYEVNKETKAMLYSSGLVVWEPPAIFKSSCQIDVEFFPFDKQRCAMKFGSWTYDGLQVDLRHVSQTNLSSPVVEYGIDLDGLLDSTEWDLLHVPAKRNQKTYPCCPEPYPDITFTIVIRRKTLFYLINLIFPCVAISFLTLFVFYLPSDSGEKTTLCISILIAVTFFFLVLAESIPPTSLVVPLIGKYLLFTLVLVTLSIVITVLEMNFNVRTPATHKMSPWTRWTFLTLLPKLLFITRPKTTRYDLLTQKPYASPTSATATEAISTAAFRPGFDNGDSSASWRILRPSSSAAAAAAAALSSPPSPLSHHRRNIFGAGSTVDELSSAREAVMRRRITRDLNTLLQSENSLSDVVEGSAADYPLNGQSCWKLRPEFAATTAPGSYSRDGQTVDAAKDPTVGRAIQEALLGVQYIAKHMRDDMSDKKVIDDWKFITRVMDRLFLLVFSIVFVLGTAGMFLQAPSMYDSETQINVSNMTFINNIIRSS